MPVAPTVPASVLVVAIAGPTRSGKGTLAKALRQAFPGPPVLGQDGYFKQGGETPECIDWRTLLKDLQKLLDTAGQDAKGQRKQQVVILEGFLLFANEQVVSCCSLRLFLQLDKDTCYERRKASKTAGLTGAAFDRKFENSIWRAFESHGNYAGLEGVAVLDATQPPEAVADAALEVVRASCRGSPQAAAASAERAAASLIEPPAAPAGAGASAGGSTAPEAASVALGSAASWRQGEPAAAVVTAGGAAAEATSVPAGSAASGSQGASAAAGACASVGGVVAAAAAAAVVDEDTSQWPLGKFRAALAASEGGRAPKNGRAVVVTTGAMNPIHLGHVQLLHQAQERLEQEGFGVVGAWASPSHDGYVLPKCRALKTVGLTSAFRVEIARRAVADDPLVAVGSWEAEFPGHWPDYPVVVKALQEELAQLPEADKLRGANGFPQVFYACGTDHAQKCNLYSGMGAQRDCGVVVVPRAGERPKGEKPKSRVYVAEAARGPVAALSSTKVRTALEARDFDVVSDAMSVEAARFLLQPTSAEYQLHEEPGRNYSKLRVPPPA